MSANSFSDESLTKLAEDAAFHFRRFVIARNELENRGCVVKFICNKHTGNYADITVDAVVTLIHPQEDAP